MAVQLQTRPRFAPAEPDLRDTIVEARALEKTYDTGKV